MNLKKKCIYMLALLLKGVKFVLIIFWLKIFLICHRCQRNRWCILHDLRLRIFPRIFEKTRTVLMRYSGAGGETDLWKNMKSKISWHCPFKGEYGSWNDQVMAEMVYRNRGNGETSTLKTWQVGVWSLKWSCCILKRSHGGWLKWLYSEREP